MKNKNVALVALLLSMYTLDQLSTDTNGDNTIVSTPNNDCTITIPTDQWDFLCEDMAEEPGAELEELAEGQEGALKQDQTQG